MWPVSSLESAWFAELLYYSALHWNFLARFILLLFAKGKEEGIMKEDRVKVNEKRVILLGKV